MRREYSTRDTQFERTMSTLLGPAIVDGNRFETLENGDEIFPSMLAAIATAKSTINFETYIYWSGVTGKDFTDALSERARAGVRVNVLIDWVGSGKIEQAAIRTMQDAGVRVSFYNPLRWYEMGRVNNRTHRKILVVDGRVGFTGGVGIADQWNGHAQDPDHWRDTHFRFEGPVVAQLQSAFFDNWTEVTGEVSAGPAYFPELQKTGKSRGQIFSSSPDGGAKSMRLMYLLVIAAATDRILLSSAYFLPDAPTRDALIEAAKRGVNVKIITPGRLIDSDLVRHASRAQWGDLLQAGIKIYEYQPTMFHCKSLIIDERFVSVGSTNFDPRSFDLNDEASLNVYDADFAATQSKLFDKDIGQSREVLLSDWQRRPLTERLLEKAASALAPLL